MSTIPIATRTAKMMAGSILASIAVLAGCSQGGQDVATLRTAASTSSNSTQPPEDLDQYGRAQALEACLVEAHLPAQLTPMGDGEAQIDWADGHEVLARDTEQVTTILEGPGGEVNPNTHQAFMDANQDPLTLDLAPALWIDGKDHTDTWTRCLQSSKYTGPTTYLEEDSKEDQVLAQRYTDAANYWIACARENGLPHLADVKAKTEGSPYGPHAEIPLHTEPALLRTLVEACPIFDEEIVKRQMEADPTLQDDILEGNVTPIPLVLTEEPDGMQAAASLPEGFDFESGEGKRYLELNEILYEAGIALEDKYNAQKTTTPNTESTE